MGSCKKEQVTQAVAGFNYKLVDQQFTVPVKVKFVNVSTGSQNYEWTFEGGSPAVSDKKEPGIVQFDRAGDHKVTLRAWNRDVEDVKEITLQLDSAVSIDFEPTFQINNFSPAVVVIKNSTVGASSYSWVFEGGVPATSILGQPPLVTFADPGDHKITLRVSNGRKSFGLSKNIVVNAALAPGFTIVPSFDDNDGEAPLVATMHNTSAGALSYRWTSTGGVINNATVQSPLIHFQQAGTYMVSLTADNGKQQNTVQQIITVLPNKNLRTFTDVKLGVNTAHRTIGSFFSTSLRRSFKWGDDMDAAGKYIDVVYFGLNQNFAYNKFISPDSAAAYTFSSIPQAMNTKIINLQESCDCGIVMTGTDFDGLDNGANFQQYNINSGRGDQNFTGVLLRRVVLYKTADGRKGAIRIKRYVVVGGQSYIVVDIKVQKTP